MTENNELFELPFVFSIHRPENAWYMSLLAKRNGKEYKPPTVAVIDKRIGTLSKSIEWVTYIDENGDCFKSTPQYIENMPTEKGIAENKKLYESWKTSKLASE